MIAFHALDHCGRKPLLRRISSEYYWPRMATDVAAFCKECHWCQSAKVGKPIRLPNSQIKVPHRRFSHLNLDILGPLPKSRGCRYMLTIFCKTSRFFQAVPLESADADSCTRAFLHHWVQYFSLPATASSDNGNTFLNQIWKGLQEYLGVKVEFTPRYRPQANAGVERQHQSLKNSLKATLLELGDKHREKWVDVLPWVLLGRRSAFQEDLGTSPFQLTFGQAPVLPGSLVGDPGPIPTKPELQELLASLEAAADVPAVPMSRHGAGPKVYSKDIDKASHVYLKLDNPLGLQHRYHGPYYINKRTGDTTIEVKTGTFKSGTDRLELHSWNNAKPAYMSEDTPVAERPKLGRPAKKVTKDLPQGQKSSSSTDCPTSTVQSEADSITEQADQNEVNKPVAPSTDAGNSNSARKVRSTRNQAPNYVSTIWSASPDDIRLLNQQINYKHT